MLIAKRLRKQNVAAYLIYMYQVEDVIRAYGLDVERIAQEYLTRFDYDDEELAEVTEWYGNLARMMQEEGCEQVGHLQVVLGTLILAADRHAELLADPKESFYNTTYYKALPYIVELRAKGGGCDDLDNSAMSEIETCLQALYGVSLLKMKGKPITPETAAALAPISQLLEMLSEKFSE